MHRLNARLAFSLEKFDPPIFPYFIDRLPEVDPELADNLISVNNDLPAFAKLTTERLGMLMGKHIVDYECVVRNTARKLEGKQQRKHSNIVFSCYSNHVSGYFLR